MSLSKLFVSNTIVIGLESVVDKKISNPGFIFTC